MLHLVLTLALATDGSASMISAPTSSGDAPHWLTAVHPGAWRPARAALGAGGAGLRVAIDPESGELVPGAPPLGTSSMADDLPMLVTETMPDGSLRLVLGDAGQSFSVLRLDARGRKHRDCLHEAAVVPQRLREPVQIPASAEVDR